LRVDSDTQTNQAPLPREDGGGGGGGALCQRFFRNGVRPGKKRGRERDPAGGEGKEEKREKGGETATLSHLSRHLGEERGQGGREIGKRREERTANSGARLIPKFMCI